MIVACVALIAAVGGTSYAASKIGSADVQNNSLKSNDVKNRALKGKDLANGTLKGRQINESKLEDVRVRWLLLNEAGQIEEQSGGFTVLDAYQTNNNAYIDTGESLVGKGLTATIAIQNQVEVDGAAGADPNFAGEVSVARCQVPGVVECAPANSKTVNALVVGPRNSDGSVTGAGSRKRVYVQVTE